MTKPPRIMVVEDERLLSEDMGRILRLAHYKVVATVPSGKLAVEKATDLEPDLILMDIVLEDEMDGIEAANAIQARLDIPIVFLTAHSDRRMFQRARSAELYGFLSKPVAERDLLYTVEMALYRHKMERELTLARQELERRVEERTSELLTANQKLRQEIAERRKVEEALKAGEERYRRLVENATDMIFLTDEKGRITYSNPVAVRMMGYLEEELSRMHFLDFIPNDYKEEAARFYRLQFVNRTPDTYHELPALTKTGELLWFGQNVRLLVEDDQVKGFLALSRDITARKEVETALQESEERYRAICETATDSIFIKDRNLTYTHVNAAMQKLFGCKQEELVGKTDVQLFGPEQGARLRAVDRRVLDGEVVSEENAKPVNDQWTTFHVVKVPLRDADGQIIGLCGIARDITQRKLAEEAIRESEQRYRLLTQNSLTGIYLIQDDRFVLANERLARIMGHDVDEIIGRTFWEFVHPDDREMVKQREHDRLQGLETIPHYEFRVTHKDGRTVWIELLATTIPFGGRMASMGNLADITDRKESQRALKQAYEQLEKRVAERTAELSQKNLELNAEIAERVRAEQALRENEARFRELAELLPEIVFEIDERGMVTFVNQRAYQITGYSPQDVENGLPASAFFAPQDRKTAELNIARSIRGETPRMTEYTAQRSDGSTFPVLARSVPIIRDGKRVGLRGIVTDISHIREAEHALRLEKRRFETLAENSPLGLVVISEEGKYLYTNPKFTELFGFEPEDIPDGRQWFRKAFPDQKYRRKVISAWVGDLKKSRVGEIRSRIFTVQCKDGTEKIIHFRPVQLETGQHFVTCEDITERKRAQEALLKSERRFRTLVEAAKDFIWTLDMNLGFTYASPAVTDLLGYTVEELMSMDPLETFSESSRERILKAFTAELEREKIEPGSSDAARFEDVAQYRKDGSLVWLELTTTLLRDHENRVQGILAISHDITHRKKAEESIRKSEETARALLNATTDGAVLVDAAGTVLASNYVFAQTHGLTPDKLAGRNLFELFPRDVSEHRKSRCSEVITSGKPVRFVDAHNNTYMDHSIYPLFDAGGRVERLAIFIRDITDQVKAEKELRIAKETAEISSSAKSQFLAAMSHELRTPLNAIIGFSEILEDQNFGPMNTDQLEFVGHILNSGNHLLRLINDILDLSKVESGKMELQSDTVRLHDLLEGSLVMVKEKARRHNLSLNLSPDERLAQAFIFADDVKLKQILFNLLSNAVKFTPDGGRIDLQAFSEGDELFVRVTDTGIGIEPHDMDRIFGVFEQADSLLARQREGTGLGLALTKRLVELHGGRIWVESPGRNQGSTFTFAIPLAIAGEADLPGRVRARPASPEGRRVAVPLSSAMSGEDSTSMGMDALEQLTKIWNRNEIIERLEAERNELRSQGAGAGVIVVCVDNFEDVAETAGFHSANVLLAEVAGRLVSSLRPSDAVGRSGLDEFVILLPGCGTEDARKAAERLLGYLTATSISTREGALSVAVSMGVMASGPEDGLDAASVIRAARRAGLKARHQGGNQVQLWDESSPNP